MSFDSLPGAKSLRSDMPPCYLIAWKFWKTHYAPIWRVLNRFSNHSNRAEKNTAVHDEWNQNADLQFPFLILLQRRHNHNHQKPIRSPEIISVLEQVKLSSKATDLMCALACSFIDNPPEIFETPDLLDWKILNDIHPVMLLLKKWIQIRNCN